FYPLHDRCTNTLCASTQRPLLKKHDARRVVAYTKANGPQPAWAIHLYCKYCNTSHRYNYNVSKELRYYHAQRRPDFIQVSDHQYIETSVVEDWRNLMSMAWVSATNCANSYMVSASFSEIQKGEWQFGSVIRTEHVWDAFKILTLLEHSARNAEVLIVLTAASRRCALTKL
ncbi:hypothetical protein BC629DRAFT_1303196, partial [Irpex lacteus]